ncbi:dihydrofolate reductase family protein [Nonomuraea sp. NPDC005650]|uniref:RibD family protein n=1 Tax=Nonomuraea sp. NPDC005650 TaxID=3157045 RepID=UPI0033BDCD30
MGSGPFDLPGDYLSDCPVPWSSQGIICHVPAPTRPAELRSVRRWLHRRHIPERLLLSNAADFDRVDDVRAHSDAISIGATTMRKDNPRLLVNSEARRNERVAQGLPPFPVKVTITNSGDLDPDLRFWHHGGDKIVYCPESSAPKLHEALAGLADVVSVGPSVDLPTVLDDLGHRGVRRLMVEGGGTVHTQFLTQGLADELQLVSAPIFVGDATAPRFVNAGDFPGGSGRRMKVAEVRAIGDVTLIRYLPKEVSDIS